MAARILIPMTLVFATVFIHTGCTALLFLWFRSLSGRHWAMRTAWRRAAVVAAVVLLMSLAAYVEAALWGAFYLGVGALSDFREAVYFSLVTYTTLGYGDVTLAEEWRVLAAFEAVNGIIMFGWTTALIVGVVQRLFSVGSPGGQDPGSEAWLVSTGRGRASGRKNCDAMPRGFTRGLGILAPSASRATRPVLGLASVVRPDDAKSTRRRAVEGTVRWLANSTDASQNWPCKTNVPIRRGIPN